MIHILLVVLQPDGGFVGEHVGGFESQPFTGGFVGGFESQLFTGGFSQLFPPLIWAEACAWPPLLAEARIECPLSLSLSQPGLA